MVAEDFVIKSFKEPVNKEKEPADDKEGNNSRD
jgi:hypothetical protein